MPLSSDAFRPALEPILKKLNVPDSGLRLSHHSSSLFPLYLLEAGDRRFALKGVQSQTMAIAEAEGLTQLRAFGARVPAVHGCIQAAGSDWLLMDFIETGSIDRRAGREDLIAGLGRLYANKTDSWGGPSLNFIGTLEQSNHLYLATTTHSPRTGRPFPFESFWWEDRILPMLERSRKRRLLRDVNQERLREALTIWIDRLKFENEQPRPVHGDLWSGNVLFAGREAYLIDPSFAFSWPEQDFAMLELFGSPLASEDYRRISSLAGFVPRGEAAIEFFQLYPLLVHVAIFGGSYEGQAHRIIQKLIRP